MKAMDECSSKDLVALSGFDGKQKRKSSVIRKGLPYPSFVRYEYGGDRDVRPIPEIAHCSCFHSEISLRNFPTVNFRIS